MNAEAEMRAALQARFPECYGVCPDCDGEGADGPCGPSCSLCADTGRVSKATLAQLRGEMLGIERSVENADASADVSEDA